MRHIFIGFDQAYANSGWAVLEWLEDKQKLVYLRSGVFHPSFKFGQISDAIVFLEHQKHIRDLLTDISGVGDLHAIGLEGIAFSAPGQAASRGGIWALYSTMSVLYADVVIISPTRLKKYLTEYGFSDKDDIKKVIEPRYGLEGRNLASDEYDAIGLAEVTAYAWMIRKGNSKDVKKILSANQLEVFLDPRLVKDLKTQIDEYKAKPKTTKKGKKRKRFKAVNLTGICDRTDNFYLEKRKP